MDRETFKIRSTESEPLQIADCRLQIEKIKTSSLNLKSEIRKSSDFGFLLTLFGSGYAGLGLR